MTDKEKDPFKVDEARTIKRLEMALQSVKEDADGAYWDYLNQLQLYEG